MSTSNREVVGSNGDDDPLRARRLPATFWNPKVFAVNNQREDEATP